MNDSNQMLWPGWETVKLIGRGSFGAVYEIQRDMFGDLEKAALKVISIPQNESDIEELYSDGYDEESITSTFQTHLKSIVAEYSMMRKMNGCSNVVNCDDIRYIQRENGIGWDIFIKMELLTPLTKTLPADVGEEMVVRIAKDLCTALELCNKHGIVHRDIKPQNIFISPNGDYKLGDFGIAKTVEKTTGGTKIGTYKYMAPEVYNNQPYGHSADIYSLGLVLYWMLNERRMPFLPMPPAKLSVSMDDQARMRRFMGEVLPPPAHGSEELKQIILKACAFAPKDRYGSARDMLDALNALHQGAAAPVRLASAPAAAPMAAPEIPAEEDATIGPAWMAARSETRESVPAPAHVPESYEEDEIADCPGEPAGRASRAPAAAPESQPEIADAEDATVGSAWMSTWSQKREPAPSTKPEPEFLPEMFDEDEATIGLWSRRAEKPTASAASVVWEEAIADNDNPDAKNTAENLIDALLFKSRMWKDDPIIMIAAAKDSAVGLRLGSTAVAVGDDAYFISDIEEWDNILSVDCSESYAVGLRYNGTVRFAGKDANPVIAAAVKQWNSIVAVSAGDLFVAGLTEHGTVVTAANEDTILLDTSLWKGVTDIAAGSGHLIGLKSDGTMVATGMDMFNACGVAAWSHVFAIAAGKYHSVACKENGRVNCTGNNQYGQCDTDDWRDIVSVKAGDAFTVGLKQDGTVVAAGGDAAFRDTIEKWTDVTRISAGGHYAIGTQKCGKILVAAVQEAANAAKFSAAESAAPEEK